MIIRLKHDQKYDVAFGRISGGKYSESLVGDSGDVMVILDVDEECRVLSIEVLNFMRSFGHVPEIAEIEPIDDCTFRVVIKGGETEVRAVVS